MAHPAYRVRLFLSADLVGSTAFKAGEGQSVRSQELHPIWVQEVKEFYRSFPAKYTKIFRESRLSGDESFPSYDAPKVWKTIGDEIITVCRVQDLNHLSYCVNSFIHALDAYSEDLRVKGIKLDIKGCGWLAAFPSPNVTIFDKSDGADVTELYDEYRECGADIDPRSHDFLGPEIDSGFRISKFSESNQFSMSAGLALCLCDAAYHSLFRHAFAYHGRQVLKGVANGNAYPIFTLDVERNAINREVRNYERAVTRDGDIVPLHLANFLRSFMKKESLNIPLLKKRNEAILDTELPECFKDHIIKWNSERETLEKMAKTAEKAVSEGDSGNDENLRELEENIDSSVAAAVEKEFASIAVAPTSNLNGT